jgi:hypothetical protein
MQHLLSKLPFISELQKFTPNLALSPGNHAVLIIPRGSLTHAS